MVAADVRVATPLARPRVGLLAAANVPSSTPERWGFGLEWQSEMPPPSGGATGARALRCDPPSVPYGDEDKPAVEQAYPFSVFAKDYCTTLGFEGRDWVGRARRALEATQSFSIAREFWTGAIAQAEGLSNVWLGAATATKVTTSALDPVAALSVLDQYVAETLRNGTGMIHVTVEMQNRLMAANAIWRDGARWRTAFDNIVSSDGGYTGELDGEDPTQTEFMVATTVPDIYLGPIRTVDLRNPDDLRTVVDRSVNDAVVWAERDVLVMHEPTLLHAVAQVDLS